MRKRYTFEILAVALLMAAGSVLRPAPPAPGCNPLSAHPTSLVSARNLFHLAGGRG